MRRTGLLRPAIAAAVLFLAAGCSVVRNIDYDATREQEEEDILATGPDALVELLGEPDDWSQEDVDGALQMTAVWYCVEDEYREVTWRSRVRARGRQYWTVVRDVTDECRTSPRP